METNIPRIMFSSPKSSEGKTTVTCAVLGALLQKGVVPCAFKCGPDYIDPMFHREIIGAESGNLDLFFTEESLCNYLLYQGSKGCDISVMEGAMGFYDGLGGVSDTASAYETAKVTQTPVVLVVDAKGSSLSVCATIQGFLQFRKENTIQGVILNRCSKMQYLLLKDVIEQECKIKTFGFLPMAEDISLKSRHLGLVTALEVADIKERTQKMAQLALENIEVDALVSLANRAPMLHITVPHIAPCVTQKPVIAVAKDKAFCFYYRENLALLEQLGARLVEFSPLSDTALPAGTDAIYIGGGYPEVYAKELSCNTAMLQSLREHIANGVPTFAECGGYMYLLSFLEDNENKEHAFVGVFPHKSFYTGKLGRFGYVSLTAKNDTLLCSAGEEIRGHEFHYYDSEDNGDAFLAKKPVGNRSWACIHGEKNVFAGYPHLYFYSNVGFAENFAMRAEEYRIKRCGI